MTELHSGCFYECHPCELAEELAATIDQRVLCIADAERLAAGAPDPGSA